MPHRPFLMRGIFCVVVGAAGVGVLLWSIMDVHASSAILTWWRVDAFYTVTVIGGLGILLLGSGIVEILLATGVLDG